LAPSSGWSACFTAGPPGSAPARGLTTAASIWVTSAIGILVGIGFNTPALVGTLVTLIVLGVFRAIEARLPSEFYAHHAVRFERGAIMPEPALKKLASDHGFTIANLSHRLTDAGKVFEYRMVIRTRDRRAEERPSRHLCSVRGIIECRVTPTGD